VSRTAARPDLVRESRLPRTPRWRCGSSWRPPHSGPHRRRLFTAAAGCPSAPRKSGAEGW